MKSVTAKFLGIAAVILPLLVGAGVVDAQGYPPPPAARVEPVPAPPPGAPRAYVWRPGYWRWNGHRYIWIAGRYVRPPRPHAAWVPAHWAQRRGRWVWVPGHWR